MYAMWVGKKVIIANFSLHTLRWVFECLAHILENKKIEF